MKEHVYFIQIANWPSGDGPIKIGHTKRDVKIRFREWQCGMPFHKLKLLGKKEGSVKLEAKLKKIFSKNVIIPEGLNSKTEWFWPSYDLKNYIERCVV